MSSWGDSIMVTHSSDMDMAIAEFKRHMGHYNCIGMDCEWVDKDNWAKLYRSDKASPPSNISPESLANWKRNAPSGKVSLLQMAAADGFTMLVRLVFFGTVPKSLLDLLADNAILKLGVNISEDCRRLYEDWAIRVNGWLDLRNVALDIPDFGRNVQNVSTSKMGLNALGQKLQVENMVEYGPQISYSNWNKYSLGNSEIGYAVQDAQLAVKILFALADKYLNLKISEPNSAAFWRQLDTHLRRYMHQQHDVNRVQRRNDCSGEVDLESEEAENSESDNDETATPSNSIEAGIRASERHLRKLKIKQRKSKKGEYSNDLEALLDGAPIDFEDVHNKEIKK